MKNLNLFLIGLTVLLLTSCGNSDDSSATNSVESSESKIASKNLKEILTSNFWCTDIIECDEYNSCSISDGSFLEMNFLENLTLEVKEYEKFKLKNTFKDQGQWRLIGSQLHYKYKEDGIFTQGISEIAFKYNKKNQLEIHLTDSRSTEIAYECN